MTGLRQPLIDYYATLGVRSSASAQEIRNSFRRLVKKHHPDRNPKNVNRAAQKMKVILLAYETLRDEVRRSDYDQLIEQSREDNRDHRRDYLLTQKGKPEGWARLVLHDLMEGNDLEAIGWYEEGLAAGAKFDLVHVLPERDWLDCKFLLAEAYERYSRPRRALDLYEEVFFAEASKRRYKYIRDDVRDRIRNLCVRRLAREAPAAEALGYYRRALQLELSKGESAFLHKKIAECLLAMGAAGDARRHLGMAFALKPNLQGARKMCDKLGMMPGVDAARS